MAQYKHDRFFKLYIKSLYDVIKGTIPPVDPIIGIEDYAIDLPPRLPPATLLSPHGLDIIFLDRNDGKYRR